MPFVAETPEEKKQQATLPAYAPQPHAPSPLETVETASQSTLPTQVVAYLGGLNSDQTDLARIAKAMAREFDVKPMYLFGTNDPSKFISPVTGKPMNVKEAQRFTNNFAPTAVASIIRQSATVSSDQKNVAIAVTRRNLAQAVADAPAIGNYAKTLARHLGDGIDASLGVAIATKLARDKPVSAERFGQNLDWVLRWWHSTSTQPLNEQQIIGYAMGLSYAKTKIGSIADVQKGLFGDQAYEAHQNYQETYDRYGPNGALRLAATSNNLASVDLGPDYWKQIEGIQNNIRLDDEAFNHSWLGRAFNELAHYQNFSYKALYTLGQGLVEPVAIAMSAITHPLGLSKAAPTDVYRFGLRLHQNLWRATEDGLTPGTLIQEHYRFPHWTAGAMDFGISWYADPLVVAGKTSAFWREARMAADVLDHESLLERAAGHIGSGWETHFDEATGKFVRTRVTEEAAAEGVRGTNFIVAAREADLQNYAWQRFRKYIPEFAKSYVSQKLFTDGVKAFDQTKYLRRIDRLRGVVEARNTLDTQYMTMLAKGIRDSGLSEPEMWKAWQEGIVGHFVGSAPEGSIAADVIRQRMNLTRITGESVEPIDIIKGRPYVESTSGLMIPESASQQLASEVYEGGAQSAFPGWLSLEAPGKSVLSEYGPRRLVRTALTSPKWTESALGKRSARLISINPGRVMSVHDAVDETMLLNARRWGTFDEVAARDFQQQTLDIVNSGRNVNTRLNDLVEKMDQQGWDAMTAQYNLSPELKQTMYDDIFGNAHGANRRYQAFGVNADNEAITKPLMESQLSNNIYVVDPIYAKQVVRRYVSMRTRLIDEFSKAIGRDVPEFAEADVSRRVIKAMDFGGDMYSGWKKFWKAATIARPAYIPRVIGIDENLRALATTGSLIDRLTSLSLASEAGPIRKGLSTLVSPLRKGEDALFEDFIRVGDEHVRIPRIGALDYEGAAVNKMRQADILSEITKNSDLYGKAFKAGNDWEVIKAIEDPGRHMNAWVHDLAYQIRSSAPGKVALESVKEGNSVEQTEKALMKWAREDNFVTLTSNIGVDPSDIDMWAQDLASTVHAYTMGDKNIANLALEGDKGNLQRLLSKTTEDARPDVHTPTVEALTSGNPINKSTDFLYKWFVQLPEDAMNRQPFYKTWFTRAKKSMYRGADAMGIELTPQIKQAMDVSARNFALGQVKRVMFDFTRQSRFTELLQFVFPFPQPFFEGFQAWGHIAWRNPEALGRGYALFHLGTQSGAIEKDPLTGEYGIGLPMYRFPAVAMASMFGGNPELAKHMDFFASLSSMNMLSQNTMKFGHDGLVGRIVGGVPVPIPSVMPWFQYPLQKIFSDSNSTLAGYLFANGPTASLLPGPVKAIARNIFPNSFNDSSTQSMALSIMEAYHRFGLDVDANGNKIPTDELSKMAQHDAGEIMGMRSLMGLFSPAALRITYDGQKQDYAAFQNYIDTSPTYSQAVDRWVKDHPDKFMIPAGKTFYDAGYGPNQPAPRIPASELVAQMYNTKGIGDFMKAHPEWAALALIGTDPAVADSQDFSTFARLISNGTMKYKNPQDYWDSGESSVVWPEIDKFYKSVWNPGIEKMQTLGTDEQDGFYQRLVQRRREAFLLLAQQHPDWAARHLVQVTSPTGEVDGYDWPDRGNLQSTADRTKYDTPLQVIRHDAMNIIHSPGLESLPGVQALQQYMDGTTAIQQQMVKRRITDINGTNATDLFASYQHLVSDLVTQYPDFKPFLRSYFGVKFSEVTDQPATGAEGEDLKAAQRAPRTASVVSTDDLVYNMSQVAFERSMTPAPLLAKADNLDTNLEGLIDKARGDFLTASDRSQNWLDVTDAEDSAWAKDPKIVQAWWRTQGQSYRTDYIQGLSTKPVAFYSQFDFRLAGIPVNKQASGWLRDISLAHIQIEQQKENDPNYSKSDGYKAIDAWVAQRLGKNKTFDTAIHAMNVWGWGLQHIPDPTTGKTVTQLPGKLGWCWTNIISTLQGVQKQVDKYGLSGINYGSKSDKSLYRAIQVAVDDRLEQYFKYSPAFKESWNAYQASLGASLVGDGSTSSGTESLFLPNDYFGAIGKAS